MYTDSLLSKNEEMVVHTRRHWVVLLKSGLTNLVIFVFLLWLAKESANFLEDAELSEIEKLQSIFFALAVFPATSFFIKYLAWVNESFIITNRRVIHCSGIFSKKVVDSSLEKVNDVVLQQSWIGRIIGFGDVEILTASEIGVNLLSCIADPVHFKQQMRDQILEFRDEEEGVSHAKHEQHNDIATLLRQLDNLRREGLLSEDEYLQKKQKVMGSI